MSTSRIILPTGPDSSILAIPAAGGATTAKITSSAAAVAPMQKVTYQVLQFAAAVNSGISWSFRLPSDYLSGGTLVWSWGDSVNNDQVVWFASPMVGLVASTGIPSSVYTNPATLSAGPGVLGPTVVGQFKETSISLAAAMLAASAAPGSFCSVNFGRNGTNGSDLARGTGIVYSAAFEYSS